MAAYLCVEKIESNVYQVTLGGALLGYASVKRNRARFKLDGIAIGVRGEVNIGENVSAATDKNSLAWRIADAVLDLSKPETLAGGIRKIAA